MVEMRKSGQSAPRVEGNGINVIDDAERKGRPIQLFWPWFAANVSVLGISYGAFTLGFSIAFGQAVVAGIIGIVFSFLLCGFIALAGKRGSAPTMVLSRAAFGVRGNKLPDGDLVAAHRRVGDRAGHPGHARHGHGLRPRSGSAAAPAPRSFALLVVAALVVGAGVLGFDVIMRLQTVITIVTAVLTVVFVVLVVDDISWATVSALPAGSVEQVIGALVFLMTGFGLGWVNTAADYSRYLPRNASSRGVVAWTTIGSSVAPLVLLVFGLLLAGSSQDLSTKIAADPIGALTDLLPTWFLVPFALVAVLGLVGGAVLDIYSSGLALLSLGLRIPRWSAALVDGVLMVLGTIWVVFFADDFLGPFQGFLYTLGVPVAAWAGIMLADIALRHHDYAERELYEPAGRYGDVRWTAVILLVVGTALGWGLVTNTTTEILSWQGYLLGPVGLGGRDGAWAFANLGVLVALVVGFVGPGSPSTGAPERSLRGARAHHARSVTGRRGQPLRTWL